MFSGPRKNKAPNLKDFDFSILQKVWAYQGSVEGYHCRSAHVLLGYEVHTRTFLAPPSCSDTVIEIPGEDTSEETESEERPSASSPRIVDRFDPDIPEPSMGKNVPNLAAGLRRSGSRARNTVTPPAADKVPALESQNKRAPECSSSADPSKKQRVDSQLVENRPAPIAPLSLLPPPPAEVWPRPLKVGGRPMTSAHSAVSKEVAIEVTKASCLPKDMLKLKELTDMNLKGHMAQLCAMVCHLDPLL